MYMFGSTVILSIIECKDNSGLWASLGTLFLRCFLRALEQWKHHLGVSQGQPGGLSV